MAKDPAVLFYTQDFLVGTITMNYEQRGKYITLLCLQHQNGKLTDKDMKSILTEEDIEIAEKFIKDTDGCWYNIRLKEEAEKRKKYTESRRNNRLKDKNKLSKTYDKLMENENEIENEDVNVIDNKNVNKNNNTNIASRKIPFEEMMKKPSQKEINELDNLV